MIGEVAAKAMLAQALHHSRADQIEALLQAGDGNLTRFANTAVHQNVAQRNATLHLRAIVGKRIGQMSTNDLSDSSIQRAVDRAYDIARLQAENVDFVSLPAPQPTPARQAFFDSTASCSPEDRAKMVAVICDLAARNNLRAAGALSTETDEIAIASSLGINAYHARTVAELSTVVMSEDSSGYGYSAAADIGQMDVAKVADEAVGLALRGRHPISLDQGEYEVVLQPYAVQDILSFLGYLGLNALAVKEQRSFMEGQFGRQFVGANISVYDDGLDPLGLVTPFDFEGVPKRHVDFFVNGIATDVVYDSYLAFQQGTQSTGHALPSPILNGPLPLNMFLKPGDATTEDLIRSVKRGLLVTRFWYTRPVHPVRVIVTGMTRDGTFLIENGEIVAPVKNLRFTQGYLDALRSVDGIASEAKLVREEEGITCRVPAIKVAKWNFVSATDY